MKPKRQFTTAIMKKTILLITVLIMATGLQAHDKGFEFRAEAYGFTGLNFHVKASAGINVTGGYRITERLFAGVGTGFEATNAMYEHVDVGDTYRYAPQHLVPVFVNIKYNMGKIACSPFVLVDAGWNFNVYKEEKKRAMYGFLFSPRAGVDIDMNKGYGLFASVGPRFQQIHRRERVAGKGDWIVTPIDEFCTLICLHLGIRF